ncbi:DUF4142 domain-containing protein [Paractinoplanes brasiliensis]|uniref:Putative outer membrane protein n=1 Tax=Paractinoplanes brasiliensis TaxID=52695 RepID=A0A4R6JBH8_9ACTN|nr:DUF4142 domain-containing protein [Actinoplanes brasiliensis]TDO33113.1 putative outer membrane protein [Actinoplanes brasiliensis]GID28831.1 hypothetical protein Abr02nite_38140 [Actinoplanes brasiliensis]
MLRPTLARRAATALAAFVAVLAAAPGTAAADPGFPTQLNAADMLLLNGVRQAGLWEIPAGQMAAQRGSPKVQQVGTMIAEQHVRLDELVVKAANELGATIPSTPTAEQQGWLGEMQNAKGRQFDQIFVTRLRAAHGKIFPVIGAVRASTRDPVVRKLADDANIFVMNHMKMLESTNLVQYERLPPAALPPAQDVSSLGIAEANAGITPPVSTTVLVGVLVVMLGVASVTVIRMVRART